MRKTYQETFEQRTLIDISYHDTITHVLPREKNIYFILRNESMECTYIIAVITLSFSEMLQSLYTIY